MVEMHLGGLDKLVAAFDRLTKKSVVKIIKSGLRVGAKIVQARVKAYIPRGPGQSVTRKSGKVRTVHLRDVIKVGAKSQRDKGTYGIRVYTPPRAVLGISASDKYYYPAAVEFGSKQGKRIWAGKRYEFRAFEASRGDALAAMESAIATGIEREAM